MNTKSQANKAAERLFPGLAPIVQGKYWKDNKCWEITCERECEYPDDKEALYETQKYFFEIEREWLVNGPREERYDVLVSGIFSNELAHLLKWCSYELQRI